ncbi:MAG: hypothetical protein JWP91_704 [Fibrobacteres bacterium]|nr:hypothetical protein [Fibrobacterota bacterium]
MPRPFLLLLPLALITAGLACVHQPRDYPGRLGSKVQEWLYYREGGKVHLITNQRIASDRELPKEIAWVIPLPAVPTEYNEEKDNLFPILFRATEILARSVPRSDGIATLSAQPSFIVHEKVFAGRYEIQALEVVDTAAGGEINDWLYSNGYAKVPQAGLKYYLRPKHCFLAIKVKGLQGKDETIKPLHIVYAAETATLPLKFFANAGTFDAYVYVIRPVPVPNRDPKGSADLEAFRIGRSGGLAILSQELRARLDLRGLPKDSLEIIRYLGSRLNGEGAGAIKDWDRDPVIDLR